VDLKFPAWPENLPQEVENKGQYYVKMTQEREMVRKIREEQERRVRDDQIRLKGKEDDLARRREQSN
jgi:flagellar biosynthesis chaperone FliJ